MRLRVILLLCLIPFLENGGVALVASRPNTLKYNGYANAIRFNPRQIASLNHQNIERALHTQILPS